MGVSPYQAYGALLYEVPHNLMIVLGGERVL